MSLCVQSEFTIIIRQLFLAGNLFLITAESRQCCPLPWMDDFFKFNLRETEVSQIYLADDVPQVHPGPHKQIVQPQFDLSLFV